ncbi:MAG: hypothetical protein GY751_04520, partial [Bacteroidetes bacterium]|nr:hypothetical protein [Bacteroidota bacterium]
NCENFTRDNLDAFRGICDAWTDHMSIDRKLPVLEITGVKVDPTGDSSHCRFFDGEVEEEDRLEWESDCDTRYEMQREGY